MIAVTGAAIVSLMQLSPMSEGLFNQVIMQSGSALVTNVVVENPNECATLLAKKLGQIDCDYQISCATRDNKSMLTKVKKQLAVKGPM